MWRALPLILLIASAALAKDLKRSPHLGIVKKGRSSKPIENPAFVSFLFLLLMPCSSAKGPGVGAGLDGLQHPSSGPGSGGTPLGSAKTHRSLGLYQVLPK